MIKIWRVLLLISAFLSLAGVVLISYFACAGGSVDFATCLAIGAAWLLFVVQFPLGCLGGVVTHEIGHAVCALLVGFKVHSIRFGKIKISRKGIKRVEESAAGESAVFPKTEKGLRGKYAFVTLGGALFNLIYGGVLLALYFVLPPHPALLFFALLAPFNLATGLTSLFPAELGSGRTDGEVLHGLAKMLPFAEVTLAVLRAQAIIYKGSYHNVSRELLYSVPVICEEDPLFFMLLHMRIQYCVVHRDEEGAKDAVRRLNMIYSDEEAEFKEETAALLTYANKVLLKDEEKAEYFRLKIYQSGTSFYSSLMFAANGDKGAAQYAEKLLEQEPLAGAREAGREMLELIKK